MNADFICNCHMLQHLSCVQLRDLEARLLQEREAKAVLAGRSQTHASHNVSMTKADESCMHLLCDLEHRNSNGVAASLPADSGHESSDQSGIDIF